jgi:hypothetical protein
MSLCPYVHIDTRQGIWTKRLKFHKVFNDKIYNTVYTKRLKRIIIIIKIIIIIEKDRVVIIGKFCHYIFCLFISFVIIHFVVICFVFLYAFSLYVFSLYTFCNCTFCCYTFCCDTFCCYSFCHYTYVLSLNIMRHATI